MSIQPTLVSALALAAILAAGGPASAAAVRTFVSGKGSDTNPCSVTAPCRSLQQAVSQTAASGEVVVLDPAGYGTVSITQSISIVNDGVGTASISVPQNGSGIAINAGSSDSVHIRGLEIDGNNAGGNTGISVSSAASVEVENCIIRHSSYGIGTTTAANTVRVEVQNATIGDNAVGISLLGNGNIVAMDTVHMPQNGIGVYIAADTTSSVNMRRCFLSGSGNNTYGVFISTGRVFLSDSEIKGEDIGVDTNGNAVAGIDRSAITANKYGLYNTQGIIFTYKNNAINYNSTQDEYGTITSYAPE